MASHIFDKCITKYLKTKTVVLVTHQIQFIKQASKILVLKEGKQLAFGTYDELVNAGVDLFSVLQKVDKPSETKEMFERQDSISSVLSKNRTVSMLSGQSEVLLCLFPQLRFTLRLFSLTQISTDVNDDAFEPKIAEEEKSQGQINSKVYVNYVKAGSGTFLMVAMVVSTLVSQTLFHYTDIWLSDW